MRRLFKNNVKDLLPYILALWLIAGLIMGRAVLSIVSAMMLLPVFFTQVNGKELKKLLLYIACLLFPVAISGFWSEHKDLWWQAFVVKLPLITILIGFLSADFTAKKIKQFIWAFNIVALLGCIWSLFQFVTHKEAIIQSYLVAKVMPTIMDDDHIRFSWFVELSMILLGWQLYINSNKREKMGGIAMILLLTAYLHFLASKTGLLCFYTSILLAVCYLLLQQNKRVIGLGLVVALLLIAFTAYEVFPTLHNRIQYVRYDFSNYTGGKFENGSSDGARILSMKAGYQIALQHPIRGVGFGDLKKYINEWHNSYHATSLAYERFNPTNEWLIYAAASGWLGMLLFSIGLIALLSILSTKNIFSICLLASLLLPLITDDSLEGQYGVAVFSMVFSLGLSLHKQSKSALSL